MDQQFRFKNHRGDFVSIPGSLIGEVYLKQNSTVLDIELKTSQKQEERPWIRLPYTKHNKETLFTYLWNEKNLPVFLSL